MMCTSLTYSLWLIARIIEWVQLNILHLLFSRISISYNILQNINHFCALLFGYCGKNDRIMSYNHRNQAYKCASYLDIFLSNLAIHTALCSTY